MANHREDHPGSTDPVNPPRPTDFPAAPREQKPKAFTVDDVMTIEDGAQSEEGYYTSIQRAINSGLWSLQGSYGRTMMAAIEEGYCMLGENAARDYYGSRIPARDEVTEGTKGSRAFVIAHMGEDWAERMESA